VTRVQPRYATGEYHALHAIHRDGTETSLRMWKDLVDTVMSFFKSVAQAVRR
jgi:hypothetical protein